MVWLIRGVVLVFALGIGIMLGQASGTTGSGSLANSLLLLCAPLNEAHRHGFMDQDQINQVLAAVFSQQKNFERPKIAAYGEGKSPCFIGLKSLQ